MRGTIFIIDFCSKERQEVLACSLYMYMYRWYITLISKSCTSASYDIYGGTCSMTLTCFYYFAFLGLLSHSGDLLLLVGVRC